MSVVIYYDNQNLFDGIGTVPVVSRNVENIYINKVSHLVNKFTLSGRLKKDNCNSGFNEVYSLSRALCSRLSKGFRQFKVEENGSTIYSYSYAIVRGISFSEDKWYNWTPYTIEIECYDDGYFESNGIIEPSQEFQVESRPDNTIQLTITTSCKGLNNNSQGIKNAKDYLASQVFSPAYLDFYWIDDFANYSFVNTSNSETVNRLTGEVSVVKTYIGQHKNFSGTYGIITYTRDISVSENGEVSVSISGTEKGSLGSDTSLIMVEYDIKTRDWYSIANQLYTQTFGSGTLFSNPVKFSIQRNVSSENISFAITYSNQQNNDVYVIDQAIITHDYEKSLNCIEVSLTIKSNFGCHATRWSNVLNYYNSLNFVEYINSLWREYGETTTLSIQEKSKSITENRYEGSISVSMTLCDDGGENCGCLKELKYSMEFVPSINQYSVSPTFGGLGCYYIEDLNASKRAQFSLRGNFLPSLCCSVEKSVYQLRNKANQIANIYFHGSDKILEIDQVSEPSSNGSVSFDFSWSADQANIIPQNLV